MSEQQEADVPVACGLGVAEGQERIQRWRSLAESARIRVTREPDAVVVRYQSDSRVRQELEDLVALEAVCCPFLVFTLDGGPAEGMLRISMSPDAGPRAVDVLDSLIAVWGDNSGPSR